jgi:hypothetical protein
VGVVLACAILLAAPVVAGGVEGSDEGVICVGDSCQPLPAEPEDPTPGTLVPNPGNPPLHIFEPKTKKKHRKGGRGHGKQGAARRPMR